MQYLVDAGAPHDGHALAEREEGGVQRVGEADVVRRQRPAHARAARQRARVQRTCARAHGSLRHCCRWKVKVQANTTLRAIQLYILNLKSRESGRTI